MQEEVCVVSSPRNSWKGRHHIPVFNTKSKVHLRFMSRIICRYGQNQVSYDPRCVRTVMIDDHPGEESPVLTKNLDGLN